MKKLHYKTFNQNIAQQNSYLVTDGVQAFLLDPGFNGDQVASYISDKNLVLTDVFLTHGHFDHIRDLLELGKIFAFAIHLHERDRGFLEDESKNYAKAFNSRFILPENLKVVSHKDNDEIMILGESLKLIHTPGHTGGSSCYAFGNRLYSGDTLFKDGVGRTDLVGGSTTELRRSLQRIEKEFSRDTIVCPGHGESAKLAQISKSNPYLANIR